MEGLTTAFAPPVAPRTGLTRADFGLPPDGRPHDDDDDDDGDGRRPEAPHHAPRHSDGDDDGDGGDGGGPATATVRSRSHSNYTLFLVPQTLYKLHPDFDEVGSRNVRVSCKELVS